MRLTYVTVLQDDIDAWAMPAQGRSVFASATTLRVRSRIQVPAPPQLVVNPHRTGVSPYDDNSAAATPNVSANDTDT